MIDACQHGGLQAAEWWASHLVMDRLKTEYIDPAPGAVRTIPHERHFRGKGPRAPTTSLEGCPHSRAAAKVHFDTVVDLHVMSSELIS